VKKKLRYRKDTSGHYAVQGYLRSPILVPFEIPPHVWVISLILSLYRVVQNPISYRFSKSNFCYLHWLLVHYRIQFKTTTFTYKSLATCRPSYLYNLLQVHQPSRVIRSSPRNFSGYHTCPLH